MFVDFMRAEGMPKMYDSMLHRSHSRWETMLKLQIVETIAAAVGSSLLILAAELPMPYEDRLATLCAVGGILGSAFAVLVWTPATHREALCIFLANSIAAYVWGPWLLQSICDLHGVEFTGRGAIGMSSTIGMGATTTVKYVGPIILEKTGAMLKAMNLRAIIGRLCGFKIDLNSDDKPNKGA